MAYLGRVVIVRENKITAEESDIRARVYNRKLLDGTKCQILLDTRATKSFISKSHYLHCKSLHLLLKFASKLREFK